MVHRQAHNAVGAVLGVLLVAGLFYTFGGGVTGYAVSMPICEEQYASMVSACDGDSLCLLDAEASRDVCNQAMSGEFNAEEPEFEDFTSDFPSIFKFTKEMIKDGRIDKPLVNLDVLQYDGPRITWGNHETEIFAWLARLAKLSCENELRTAKTDHCSVSCAKEEDVCARCIASSTKYEMCVYVQDDGSFGNDAAIAMFPKEEEVR